MAEFQFVRLDEGDGVVRITMDRPPLNVLNIAMMEEMERALGEVGESASTRLIVLEGAGKAFCAGVDVADHTEERMHRMLELIDGVCRTLGSVGPPTMAVVQGAALGGGCELVASADLAIAYEKATFGQPESKVGVFPPVAAAVFPGLMGRKAAMEMILSGDTVDAATAQRLGLVNRVVPADSLEAEARAFQQRLSSLSGPVLQAAKQAAGVTSGDDLDARLGKVERIYLERLMRTQDAREGLQAFLEKRRPAWQHR